MSAEIPASRQVGDEVAPGEATLVLSAERASVVGEWTATTRVRISKRIVTEIQTIEVEVRREEIVVTEEPLEAEGAVSYPVGTAPEPLREHRYTLLAEVPSVSLAILPIEQVTVSTHVVTEEQQVDVALRSERLEPVEITPVDA